MASFWLKYGNSVLGKNGANIGFDGSYDPYNPLGLPPYTLRFKFDDTSYDPSVDNNDSAWTRVSSDPNVWDYTKSSSNWSFLFSEKFPSLTGYMHLLGANSTGVTNMNSMFAWLGYLRTICLFDTSAVTDMRAMLLRCENLLSLPAFNTANVTSLYQFCSGCTTLQEIPLLNTAKVKYWQAAFQYMSGLRAIPLLDTSSAVDMGFTFSECYNVERGAAALYRQASSQTNPPAEHQATFSSAGSSSVSGNAELYQIPTTWGGKAPAYGSATIGDKTYTTLKMPDGKEWMVENLDYAFEGAGDTKYYNDDETTYGWNGLKYGKLYTGRAAIALNQNRATLCPGWHVPSLAEYVALGTALGGTWNAYETVCPDVGTALKSTTEWTYAPGTDLYRFAAKPAGYYYTNSATPWGGLGTTTRFWTTTMKTGSSVYQRAAVLSGNENLTNADALQIGSYDKSYEYCSIRLVKDSQ